MTEPVRLSESASLGTSVVHRDDILWQCNWKVEKFYASDISLAGLDPVSAQEDDILAAGVAPYEELVRVGNILTYGGASALWHRLIGGTSVAAYSNANAYIGVGDSTTSTVATQTDLIASSNKTRKAMDSTYPIHTDGTADGAQTVTFKSTFGTGDANYAWNEWGVFNASTSGRMLNRKVESLGTKTSSATWSFTVALTLA